MDALKVIFSVLETAGQTSQSFPAEAWVGAHRAKIEGLDRYVRDLAREP